jgi:hypothetical protein
MQAEGVVFAPYNVLPVLGAEATQQHYECIHAVNQAVLVGLASRYAVRPARRRPSNGGVPASLRGPAGPRVAVHVQAFRCGLVVGEEAYTSVASGDPGGPRVVVGEVVLSVHDRSTGAAIIDVRAEATGVDGLAAARAAADTAVRRLTGGGASAADAL